MRLSTSESSYHLSYCHSAGRRQTKVLCPLVLGRSSQMHAALFLQFFALCCCWQGCRHSKAEKDLCSHSTVRGSVFRDIIVGQVLPDTCRSLNCGLATKIWSICLKSCGSKSQGLASIHHLDFFSVVLFPFYLTLLFMSLKNTLVLGFEGEHT
jgi:hypothetical protein